MRAAAPRLRSVFLLAALVLLGLGVALSQSPAEAQGADQPGTVTFTPVAPLVAKPITASLSDPNGPPSGSTLSPTWQWAASNTRTGTFTDISGATSASFTPGEDHDGLFLRATASYTDGHGSGKTAHGVTTVRVNVEPPRFTSATPEAVDVPENTTQVTELKAEGVSTLIRYAIDGGADAAKFEVTTAVESNALVYRLVFKEAPDYETAGDVLSTTPDNAAGNNEYVVRVRASYRTGLGDSVSRATTRTIIVTVTDVDETTGAPGVVTNLTATPGYHKGRDTFNVKATWTAPNPAATRYKVELLQGARVWGVKRPAATATEAGFNALNPGEAYKIRVTAYKGKIAGTAVEKAFTALSRPAAPGAVTDLELTPGYVGGSYTIVVEWTPPDPKPTGDYVVDLIDRTESPVVTTWRKNPRPGASKTVFNAYLKAGTQYTVKVTPHNQGDGTTAGGKTAGPTVTGTVTTLSPPTAPGAVAGLTVKYRDPNVIATWTAPDPAPTGEYQIKLDQGAGTRVLQEVWTKDTKVTFAPRYDGKTYRVSVTPHNANAFGQKAGPTATETVTVPATPPPPPPAPGPVTGLTLEQTEDGEVLIVSWTPPNPAPTGRYLAELFEGTDDSSYGALPGGAVRGDRRQYHGGTLEEAKGAYHQHAIRS